MTDNIVIFGGSGFLGRRLSEKLHKEYNITIATRNIKELSHKFVPYDGVNTEEYKFSKESAARIIEGKNIVINLSGASIAGKRWNNKYKQILRSSRIDTAKLIVSAIAETRKKPECFISTSATGIYGDRGDEILTEDSSHGDDYLAEMCTDWEKETLKAMEQGVRTICIRTGVVLDRTEGGFARMAAPFKFFAGGALGSGKQYLPWIHTEDIINIFAEAIKNTTISGIINGTAPNPVTNYEFSKTLGRILRRPSFFRVPVFVLRILVGELAEFITSSQRVVPVKLVNGGFRFSFPEIEPALKNILERHDIDN
jgi:uncharacterized protein